MYIKSLIHKRLFDSEFQLFDPKGLPVDVQEFRSNFLKLRSWLSQNVNGGVGIKLPKDHRYLMTMLACIDSGVFYVPMRDNYPENRISQIQEETDFTLLLNEDVFDSILKGPDVEYKERSIHANDVMYIICTSGSTGRPKAVVVEWGAITYFIRWVSEKFSHVGSADKAIQVTDFTFDISLIDVSLFLGNGCSLYFSEFKGNIFTLAYEIEKYGITVLNTVVNNVNMLLDEKVVRRADYSKLHTVMMGGARFSYGLYKKCKEYFSKIGVHNLYGVTEVPVYSHCKTMKFDDSDLHEFTVSVGKPLGACSAIVVKDGKRVSHGEKGEILIGGGSLMKEYSNNPEQTAEVFTEFEGEKYYLTKDIGFQNGHGDFFITGRMDDTIKYRGYRINLLDIDSYILSRPYVQDCVTIAIDDEDTQSKTICFIISQESKTDKEVKQDLGRVLLEYQIPEIIYFVDSFPINNNGKVCKKTLREDIIAGKRFSHEYRANSQ
jgi:acyl-coenzyme A synthetase/AMP-(fatty) acid ligase